MADPDNHFELKFVLKTWRPHLEYVSGHITNVGMLLSKTNQHASVSFWHKSHYILLPSSIKK